MQGENQADVQLWLNRGLQRVQCGPCVLCFLVGARSCPERGMAGREETLPLHRIPLPAAALGTRKASDGIQVGSEQRRHGPQKTQLETKAS